MRSRNSCRRSIRRSTCVRASHPDEAVAVLDNEPDVALVLLDLALPGARGLDFLGDLKLDYPGVPVVVLSATHDQATVMAALGAGAHGFIPKTADAGNAPRRRAPRSRRRRRARCRTASPMPDGDGVQIDPRALGLTARQTDVLKLLVQGKPNKLICRDLQAVGRHGQGPRQRDPEGAARPFAHGGRSPRSRVAASASIRWRRVGPRSESDRRADLSRSGRSSHPANREPIRCQPAAFAPSLLAHARADQIASLYRSWHRTTVSMVLGALILCGVLWEQESGRTMAVWFAAILANQAWRGVLARAYRRAQPGARRMALGSVLGGRLDARRRAVGRRGGRDVSRVAAVPGAVHRLPVQRHPRRTQPHRGLPAVVLRIRAGGARAADRARRDRRRSGASLHRAGAGRRARFRARLRTPGQRRADAVARDALREPRPDRRAQGADRSGAGGARRRRDSEPRQEPVSRGGEPRPAPAAARDGTVRRGARREGARSRRQAARREHPRVGRGARGAVRAAPRPVAAGSRRAAPGARGVRARTAVRRASPPISRRRRSRTGSRCGSCARGSPSTPIPCCSSASCATSSTNAVRYTREGGVVLGARRRGGTVRIDVVDTGHRHRRGGSRARVRRVRAAGGDAAPPRRRARNGTRASRSCGGSRICSGTRSNSTRRRAAARAFRSPCRGRRCRAVGATRIPPGRNDAARSPRRRRSPAGRSSSSTTIPPWSRRCARCSRRGRRSPSAARTPTAALAALDCARGSSAQRAST